MLNTLKILTAALLISVSGCDGVDVNLGEEESAEKNKDDEGGKACPAIAQLFCVEKEPGIYESLAGTQDAECQSIAPEGKVVDYELCDQSISCTEEAKLVCKELSTGVYIETGIGRQGPKCEFPTEGVVDAEYCKGNVELADLASAAQLNDGKLVSVTGSFKDFRNEPQPDCAEPTPFGGSPVLSTEYLPDQGGFGVQNETVTIKASFVDGDSRNMNSDFIGKINPDSQVTLRGTFRYKTVVPACFDGSIVYPSGTIELNAIEQVD